MRVETLPTRLLSLVKERFMSQSVQAAHGAISLTVIDGTPTTTSNEVAQHFGKEHAKVLRSIELLIESNHATSGGVEFNARNFCAVEYTDTKGERRPAYRLTRDGFTLLAMGFTGKKALTFKLAYIDAFNRMEAALQKTAPPQADTLSPAQKQHLHELVDLIAEAGKQSHAETWSRFHRKFKVNSYHALPAEQYMAACNYLRGKIDDNDMSALVAKHFQHRRFVAHFNESGGLSMQAIPFDAAILSYEQIPRHMPEMSNQELTAINAASGQALAQRLQNLSKVVAVKH
jgi:Rha family phage regulatory protein